MRKHLLQCLVNGKMTEFPGRKRKPRTKKSAIIPVHVFCKCRQPECGEMAECDQCHEWFLKKCESIPDGEVGWGLMMVLLWPHSWSKFIDLLFLFLITYHLDVCISCFYFLFLKNDKLKQKKKQKKIPDMVWLQLKSNMVLRAVNAVLTRTLHAFVR